LARAERDELTAIEEVGPVVAESVHFFFRRPENLELLRKLKEAGLRFAAKKAKDEGPRRLSGQTFVLTGKLARFSRDEAKDMIERLGGAVTDSISSHTSYLVLGEDPGSKLARAKKIGVPTLSEEEFLKLIGA